MTNLRRRLANNQLAKIMKRLLFKVSVNLVMRIKYLVKIRSHVMKRNAKREKRKVMMVSVKRKMSNAKMMRRKVTMENAKRRKSNAKKMK